MAALVGIHVDVLQRDLRRLKKRLLDRRGNADKTHDETVMVFVSAVIEEIDPAFALKTIHYFIYYILSSAFAEVWYTFDQLHCHN